MSLGVFNDVDLFIDTSSGNVWVFEFGNCKLFDCKITPAIHWDLKYRKATVVGSNNGCKK